MSTKLELRSLISICIICIVLICCWPDSIAANPVSFENRNQLDMNETIFEAGEPLTEEEFNSGVQSKGGDHGARPWENQPHSGLVGGDKLPGDKNYKNTGVKWPNGQIPYVISSSFSAQERRVIASAMTTYHQKTCIRFVARCRQSDYVKIIRSKESKTGWAHYPGCWAQKGKIGGAQELSLDNNYGCVTLATVIHELMHVVGFDHEQERPDQKRYIIVKYDNIARENHQWFTPKPSDAINSIGRYDLNSVMHYGTHTYAIDSSKPTMIARNGQTTMGNEKGLTWMDVYKLKKLYCASGY